MALIRWEPVRELHTMQNEMNRLFNTFLDSPTQNGGNTPRGWIPATDLIETEAEYVLRADLPGLTEGDVNIELDEHVLTISGERKPGHEVRKEGFYRIERPAGRFSRSLTLPEGVQADSISANFDRGVLEVRIPKPEQRKPRKVSIAVGGGAKTIEASEHGAAEGASAAEAS